MWLEQSGSISFRNSSALTDCSIVLYVMAERWPHGKKYRDLFEMVKQSALEAIEHGKHVESSAITSMKDDIQMSLRGVAVDTAAESVSQDFDQMKSVSQDLDQMISDMAGHPVSFWQDQNMPQDDVMIYSGVGNTFGQDTWDLLDSSLWCNAGNASL
jgi:hypothetical protein